MWDALITLGTATFIPGLMPTLLNSRAYVPRATSAVSVLGLTVVVVGLAGSGLVLSPIISSVMVVLWAFVYLFRGQAA